MPPEDTQGPLEDLERKLYSSRAVDGVAPGGRASSAPRAAEHWKEPPPPPAKKRPSLALLFLGFALAFFLVAGIATAVILFMGGRSVSSDNVSLTADGPVAAAGGEDVPITVTVKNQNPAPMTGVMLSLQFPDGTTEATDTAKALGVVEEAFDDIPAGGSARRTVHAAFFGTENQKVSIPVTLEYKTSDSNATFVKKTSYDFTISTSPVGLTVTTLSEIASGQSLTLSLLVRSNATAPLPNVAVLAGYPTGFSLTSASPTSADGSFFPLGTLNPGEEKEIRVTGTLTGVEGDERDFRFAAGSLSSPDAKTFAVTYLTKDAPITVAKPFFSVDLALDHDSSSPTVIANEGDDITGLLTWTNALSSTIQNGTISVALAGDALADKVDATNGFYRSSDKTVLFDRDTAQGLARLNPGDTGNGSFTFRTKTGTAFDALRNPAITVTVSVSGNRAGETGVPETVNATIVRTVKIATTLALAAKATHTGGPYANTGPWPPVANQETQYAILLSVANSVNSVANASATLTLPSYVRYVQGGPGVSYNDSTRTVTWAMGDLAAGAKGDAAFQVALLPSTSQKGSSPALTSDISASGFDRFVGGAVSATAGALDSEVRDDAGYVQADGTVQ